MNSYSLVRVSHFMVSCCAILRSASPVLALALATCSLPSDLHDRPTFALIRSSADVIVAAGDIATCEKTTDEQTTGALREAVDINRKGAFLTSTQNDGSYVNGRSFTGTATYGYKVCETGSAVCSNTSTVLFQ